MTPPNLYIYTGSYWTLYQTKESHWLPFYIKQIYNSTHKLEARNKLIQLLKQLKRDIYIPRTQNRTPHKNPKNKIATAPQPSKRHYRHRISHQELNYNILHTISAYLTHSEVESWFTNKYIYTKTSDV